MRIGELSGLTGVSVRSLRYYEEQGLLRPLRLPSGYREYRAEDAATVRGIRILLAAGLGTATIAELLPCMDGDGHALAPACGGMLPELQRERERLSAAAADIRAARDRLDALIEATARLDPVAPSDCDAATAPGRAPSFADT
ncbi:MerR family transcriptional regulator [Pseudonocardia kunmingensis]|uniref:DNA-binding transcriptional MerR regulator n=1 Tax=Pseudonocardia kunmingensis TaxID=630975 RepID=A0A543DKY4_9PSEU|nr:MerR family transcriptional regulator [Pseudonocardia kunmingensis]TQM09993.1 DNA-binding transcriptional MerR regulator [Pseudonocardia kunmingensis]